MREMRNNSSIKRLWRSVICLPLVVFLTMPCAVTEVRLGAAAWTSGETKKMEKGGEKND